MKDSWCTYLADGSGYCCMRVQSPVQMANGGWFFRTDAPVAREQWVALPPSKPAPAPPAHDWNQMVDGWMYDTVIEQQRDLAISLGVSVKSLIQLQACWAPQHKAWAFPMRSYDNDIVGIRLRNSQGQKWAVKGSKQGLFIPQACPPHDVIWLCEGPTDTAALLSIGLYAVGRPNCSTGGPEILRFAKDHKIKKAVIVVDNDEPGKNGAVKLSKELTGMAHIFFVPNTKDVRQMIKNGATKQQVEATIQSRVWIWQ